MYQGRCFNPKDTSPDGNSKSQLKEIKNTAKRPANQSKRSPGKENDIYKRQKIPFTEGQQQLEKYIHQHAQNDQSKGDQQNQKGGSKQSSINLQITEDITQQSVQLDQLQSQSQQFNTQRELESEDFQKYELPMPNNKVSYYNKTSDYVHALLEDYYKQTKQVQKLWDVEYFKFYGHRRHDDQSQGEEQVQKRQKTDQKQCVTVGYNQNRRMYSKANLQPDIFTTKTPFKNVDKNIPNDKNAGLNKNVKQTYHIDNQVTTQRQKQISADANLTGCQDNVLTQADFNDTQNETLQIPNDMYVTQESNYYEQVQDDLLSLKQNSIAFLILNCLNPQYKIEQGGVLQVVNYIESKFKSGSVNNPKTFVVNLVLVLCNKNVNCNFSVPSIQCYQQELHNVLSEPIDQLEIPANIMHSIRIQHEYKTLDLEVISQKFEQLYQGRTDQVSPSQQQKALKAVTDYNDSQSRRQKVQTKRIDKTTKFKNAMSLNIPKSQNNNRNVSLQQASCIRLNQNCSMQTLNLIQKDRDFDKNIFCKCDNCNSEVQFKCDQTLYNCIVAHYRNKNHRKGTEIIINYLQRLKGAYNSNNDHNQTVIQEFMKLQIEEFNRIQSLFDNKQVITTQNKSIIGCSPSGSDRKLNRVQTKIDSTQRKASPNQIQKSNVTQKNKTKQKQIQSQPSKQMHQQSLSQQDIQFQKQNIKQASNYQKQMKSNKHDRQAQTPHTTVVKRDQRNKEIVNSQLKGKNKQSSHQQYNDEDSLDVPILAQDEEYHAQEQNQFNLNAQKDNNQPDKLKNKDQKIGTMMFGDYQYQSRLLGMQVYVDKKTIMSLFRGDMYLDTEQNTFRFTGYRQYSFHIDHKLNSKIGMIRRRLARKQFQFKCPGFSFLILQSKQKEDQFWQITSQQLQYVIGQGWVDLSDYCLKFLVNDDTSIDKLVVLASSGIPLFQLQTDTYRSPYCLNDVEDRVCKACKWTIQQVRNSQHFKDLVKDYHKHLAILSNLYNQKKYKRRITNLDRQGIKCKSRKQKKQQDVVADVSDNSRITIKGHQISNSAVNTHKDNNDQLQDSQVDLQNIEIQCNIEQHQGTFAQGQDTELLDRGFTYNMEVQYTSGDDIGQEHILDNLFFHQANKVRDVKASYDEYDIQNLSEKLEIQFSENSSKQQSISQINKQTKQVMQNNNKVVCQDEENIANQYKDVTQQPEINASQQYRKVSTQSQGVPLQQQNKGLTQDCNQQEASKSGQPIQQAQKQDSNQTFQQSQQKQGFRQNIANQVFDQSMFINGSRVSETHSGRQQSHDTLYKRQVMDKYNNFCNVGRMLFKQQSNFKHKDQLLDVANKKQKDYKDNNNYRRLRINQIGNISSQKDLKRYLRTQLHKENDPVLCLIDLLIQNENKGLIKGDGNMVSFIIEWLNSKKNRKWSKKQLHFYNVLMNVSGSSLAQCVSDTLEGPCLSTIKNFQRENKTNIQNGLSVQDIAVLLRQQEHKFKKLNIDLKQTPCIIGEDSTSLVQTVQTQIHRYGENFEVVVAGLNDGSKRVTTLKEVEDLINDKGDQLAKLIHVYTLVPLNGQAFSIPIAVYLHDATSETFNSSIVKEHWDKIMLACIANEIQIVGYTADGAGANRNAAFNQHCVFKDAKLEHVIPLDSLTKEFQQYAVELWEFYRNNPLMVQFPYLTADRQLNFFCDFVHLMWRLRSPLINVDRNLKFGSEHSTDTHHLWKHFFSSKEKERVVNLTPTDLDFHDKQNLKACYKLFMFNVDACGNITKNGQFEQDLKDNEGSSWGQYLYSKFCHYFISNFVIVKLTPEEMIKRLGYVISFLGMWNKLQSEVDMFAKQNLKDETQKLDQYLKQNCFITNDTFQDVIFTCNSMIYLLIFIGRFDKDKEIQFDRISTRFNEYIFQFIRSYDKGNNSLNSETAINYLNLYDLYLDAKLFLPEMTVTKRQRQYDNVDNKKAKKRRVNKKYAEKQFNEEEYSWNNANQQDQQEQKSKGDKDLTQVDVQTDKDMTQGKMQSGMTETQVQIAARKFEFRNLRKQKTKATKIAKVVQSNKMDEVQFVWESHDNNQNIQINFVDQQLNIQKIQKRKRYISKKERAQAKQAISQQLNEQEQRRFNLEKQQKQKKIDNYDQVTIPNVINWLEIGKQQAIKDFTQEVSINEVEKKSCFSDLPRLIKRKVLQIFEDKNGIKDMLSDRFKDNGNIEQFLDPIEYVRNQVYGQAKNLGVNQYDPSAFENLQKFINKQQGKKINKPRNVQSKSKRPQSTCDDIDDMSSDVDDIFHYDSDVDEEQVEQAIQVLPCDDNLRIQCERLQQIRIEKKRKCREFEQCKDSRERKMLFDQYRIIVSKLQIEEQCVQLVIIERLFELQDMPIGDVPYMYYEHGGVVQVKRDELPNDLGQDQQQLNYEDISNVQTKVNDQYNSEQLNQSYQEQQQQQDDQQQVKSKRGRKKKTQVDQLRREDRATRSGKIKKQEQLPQIQNNSNTSFWLQKLIQTIKQREATGQTSNEQQPPPQNNQANKDIQQNDVQQFKSNIINDNQIPIDLGAKDTSQQNTNKNLEEQQKKEQLMQRINNDSSIRKEIQKLEYLQHVNTFLANQQNRHKVMTQQSGKEDQQATQVFIKEESIDYSQHKLNMTIENQKYLLQQEQVKKIEQLQDQLKQQRQQINFENALRTLAPNMKDQINQIRNNLADQQHNCQSASDGFQYLDNGQRNEHQNGFDLIQYIDLATNRGTNEACAQEIDKPTTFDLIGSIQQAMDKDQLSLHQLLVHAIDKNCDLSEVNQHSNRDIIKWIKLRKIKSYHTILFLINRQEIMQAVDVKIQQQYQHRKESQSRVFNRQQYMQCLEICQKAYELCRQRNLRFKKQVTHRLRKFIDQGTYFLRQLDSMETLIQNRDFVAILIENQEDQRYETYYASAHKLIKVWENRKDIFYTIDQTTDKMQVYCRLYKLVPNSCVGIDNRVNIQPVYGFNQLKFITVDLNTILLRFYTAAQKQTSFLDEYGKLQFINHPKSDVIQIDRSEIRDQETMLAENNKNLASQIVKQNGKVSEAFKNNKIRKGRVGLRQYRQADSNEDSCTEQ